MRDFSIPPYNLGEIGKEVKRLGDKLNIECALCAMPRFKEQGYVSLPTLSEDIVRIGNAYGLAMTVTGDLAGTGIQLQKLITFLRERGVVID